MGLLILKKMLHRRFAAIENHIDVSIACRPHLTEEQRAFLLGHGRDGIAQLVEGLTQGGSPPLVPARLATVATTVGAPTFHAMRAAPRGVVDDFALPLRRKLLEEAGVVGELDG